jgi:hypothetical protein
MTSSYWEVLNDDSTDFDVKVRVNDDKTMTISWDETHPIAIENGMNFWTPQQWVDLFSEYLEAYPETH